MKRSLMTAAIAASLAAIGGQAMAAPLFADLAAVVDESGSMAGDQAWLKAMVPTLDSKLVTDHGLTPNPFSMIGFGNGISGNTGAGNRGRRLNSGTSAAFAGTATSTAGSIEDGCLKTLRQGRVVTNRQGTGIAPVPFSWPLQSAVS